jgi:protein-S-isoprenylcysteine O-methyltransferase Ste14
LVVLNVQFWLVRPFSILQLISWILLVASAVVIISAVTTLRRLGKPDPTIPDPSRLSIEKTTQLVTSGPYRFIRHPMYASVLLLAWGVFLKQVTILTICLVAIVTAMLYLTALLEERENQVHFGESYSQYMQQTKRFIPLLL